METAGKGAGGKGGGFRRPWSESPHTNGRSLSSQHATTGRLAAVAASSAAAAVTVPGPEREKFDPLANPLRGVLCSFTCSRCGLFDENGSSPSGLYGAGDHLCCRCLSGKSPQPKRCAYTSVMYGDVPMYVLGALVLGFSLQRTGTKHERVLLHTADVPKDSLQLLAAYWRLQEVEYIHSAQDLHTAPYDKARFKEVFTKLQIFDPELLPFDRVVFLDLDMLVLKNIDELFELRPPAAMCNMKSRSSRVVQMPEHGERMEPEATYINAGTMVVAPSMWLHDLLARDVQEPDAAWHRASWSPEQAYLSGVLAGEWTHVSQLYNLEVQLHSGVPLSEIWQGAETGDVAVAHFSGAQKVWDLSPDADVSVVGSDWVRQSFARLPESVCTNTTVRCQALHAEWHRVLATALRDCRERGLGQDLGPRWSGLLHAGGLRRPSPSALPATLLPGELAVLEELQPRPGERLCTVIRRSADGAAVVWSTPHPNQFVPFCAGDFGLCHALSAEEASRLRPLGAAAASGSRGEEGEELDEWEDDGSLPLGSQAASLHGRGHQICTVIGSRRGYRCVRFDKLHPPKWKQLLVLQRKPTESWEEAVCWTCNTLAQGAFDSRGLWFCRLCAGPPSRPCPA